MSQKDIILRAAGIESASERAAYLKLACGDNEQLQRKIESVLNREREMPEDEAHPDNEETEDFSGVLEMPAKKMLGPYKLMEKIGEGGMGVIFVAEQSHPVRRRVAVKVIKPGADTKEVIARFNAERQALAMMDHPNIAKVFDAGATPEGRPFFVMELVRGIPITKFCDQNKLTSRQRLELFIDVCHAIQHAHQKGIIHRDIKPSNVLVTSHDGKAVVKVIDFGVSKAIHQQLTEHTVYTKFSQIIGTPLYMSPEQAESSGLDIDTRSDIFSLGVLLYELLTGDTPFDRTRIKEAPQDEMRRILREEEPPRPSTKISGLGDTADSVSQSRGTDPKKLSLTLRGDLDWIVMKAMEKDRTRRYETANGFALDVARYLNDEPVLASPPSTMYRLRKLIHRNRSAFAASALVGTLLIVGVLGTTYGMVSAMRANATVRKRNNQLDASNQKLAKANSDIQNKIGELAAANEREATARGRAERVKEFLVEAFRKADPTQEGRRLTVVEVLNRSVVEIDTELAGEPRTQADLLAAIGRSYLGMGMYAESLEVFRRERELRSQIQPPEIRLQLLANQNYAHSLHHNGQYQAAIELLEVVLQKQIVALGEDHSETLRSQSYLAKSFSAVNRTKEALHLCELVVKTRRATQGEDHQDTLAAVEQLAAVHQTLGDFDQALSLFKANLEKYKQVFGDDHPLTLGAIVSLGSFYRDNGKFDRAIPLYEHTSQAAESRLGADHPTTLWAKSGLGIALRDAGELEKAISILKEVLTIKQKKLGPNNHSTLASVNNVARVYLDLGRYKDALPLVKDCFESHREMLGRNAQATVASMSTLGETYFYAGQPDKALPIFAELVEIEVEAHGENNPATMSAKNDLAMCYRYVGQLDKALPLFEETYRWRRENLDIDHPKTLASQQNLAGMYRALGRLEESIEMSEATVKLHIAKLGKAHRQTVSAMRDLSNAYAHRGDYRKSLLLARDTLAATVEALGETHPETVRAINSVAIAALSCGYTDEATEMFRKSMEMRQKELGLKHPHTLQAMANLATALIQGKRTEEALEAAKRAKEAADMAVDSQDPVALNVSYTLARANMLAGNHEEAASLLQAVLAVRKPKLGAEHPNTVKTQHYLGQTYLEREMLAEAVETLQAVAKIRSEKLGESSRSTLSTRSLLGQALLKQEHFEKAEEQFALIWKHQPQVGDAPMLPAERNRRVQTAKRFIELYEAWDKPESLAEWNMRKEVESNRPTVDSETAGDSQKAGKSAPASDENPEPTPNGKECQTTE